MKRIFLFIFVMAMVTGLVNNATAEQNTADAWTTVEQMRKEALSSLPSYDRKADEEPMDMMKTLEVNGKKYEVIDEQARNDIKKLDESVNSLSEEIEALKGEGDGAPSGVEYEVLPGYISGSGTITGATGVNSKHTSLISLDSFTKIEIGTIPGGTGYVCFFDSEEQYLRRQNFASGYVITPTSHVEAEGATYLWLQWYRDTGTTEEEFRGFITITGVGGGTSTGATVADRLTVLEKASFKAEKNMILSKDFYVMPAWSGMVDWIEDFPESEATNSFVNDSTFTEWYSRYHALLAEYADVGLEEIDMSTQYLADNPDDSVPAYITDIENGGMYLYHLPPLGTDGSSYVWTGKHTKVLLISALHGIEKASIYNNFKLLRDLCENTGEHRDITIMRNFCDIYVLPLASPWGVQNASRYNGNGINLNRDFAVANWIPREEEGYPTEPNSQFETRLISYWIKKLSPQVVNDLHTSSGNEETETGKFINWGGSIIPQINVLLEQHIRDVTPYVRSHFAPKFDQFKSIVFGHAEAVNTGTRKSGRLPNYACQQGAFGISFEIVRRLRWNVGTAERPNYVSVLSSEENQAELCAMNYFTYRHWLIEFVTTAAYILNHTDRWDEYVELFNSNENFDTM